jgi:hypothetical protein
MGNRAHSSLPFLRRLLLVTGLTENLALGKLNFTLGNGPGPDAVRNFGSPIDVIKLQVIP